MSYSTLEPLPIGTIVRLNQDPALQFTSLLSCGMAHFQLGGPPDSYLYGEQGRLNTERLKAIIADYGMTCTSVFLSFLDQNWSRPKETVGLVPEAWRAARLVRSCRIANWAKELGVDEIVSHIGFVPEDAESEEYRKFIADLRVYVQYLQAQGQVLNFETGQETVEVLGRMIRDLDMPNLGINLDPANLLYYNVDGPEVLIERLGGWVRHMHCKDAVRPAEAGKFGHETPLGAGGTNFESILKTLCARGFRGPLIIEREIPPGLVWKQDVLGAIALLNRIKQEVLK